MISITCPDAGAAGFCLDPTCLLCRTLQQGPAGRMLLNPGFWILTGGGMPADVQLPVISNDGTIFGLGIADEIPPAAIPADTILSGPFLPGDSDNVAIRRHRLDALLDIEREVIAFLENHPDAIRVREGGGPENIAASLGINIARLISQVDPPPPPVPEVIHVVGVIKPDEEPFPLVDCPRCGAKPPVAHSLGGGPGFDGIRTCGNGCGTWDPDDLYAWNRIWNSRQPQNTSPE